jgi:uncharacterized protein YdaL
MHNKNQNSGTIKIKMVNSKGRDDSMNMKELLRNFNNQGNSSPKSIQNANQELTSNKITIPQRSKPVLQEE